LEIEILFLILARESKSNSFTRHTTISTYLISVELRAKGVLLAEIPASDHFPTYSNSTEMWKQFAAHWQAGVARDSQAQSPETTNLIHGEITTAFEEDKQILEEQQRSIELFAESSCDVW
jgi:hypothetical protein